MNSTESQDNAKQLTEPESSNPQRRPPLKQSLAALLTTLVVLAATTLAHHNIKQWEQERLSERFSVLAHQAGATLAHDIENINASMAPLAALLTLSPDLSHKQFNSFTSSVIPEKLAQGKTAPLALGWAPRVLAAQRSELEARAQSAGYEHFQFTQSAAGEQLQSALQAKEYYPLYFLSSYRGNEALLGYNLAADPIRFSTLQTALERNLTLASAPVKRINSMQPTLGVSIFMPVFSNGEVPNATAARRASIRGFIVAEVAVDQLLSGAFNSADSAFASVSLSDISDPSDPVLLAEFNPAALSNTNKAFTQNTQFPVQEESFDVAARQWHFSAQASEDFVSRNSGHLATATLVLGLIMSLLSGMMSYLYQQRKRQAQALTQSLSKHEEALAFQAKFDSLTLVLNRTAFEKRLSQVIDSARTQGTVHSLLYLDVDEFKLVNDASGREAGDQLLQELTALLKKDLRSRDTLARLGGDEFAILLENCQIAKASDIANALRKSVENYNFKWDDNIFDVGVSIGVTCIQEDSGDLHSVLTTADMACYMAKELGRNRVHTCFSDDGDLIKRKIQVGWASEITKALSEGRLTLYCQEIVPTIAPIISPTTGQSEDGQHLECTVRLVDRGGQLVSPDVFIPAAERFRLLPTVDRWVVHNALGMLARVPNLARCYIKLSAQSINQEFFLDAIQTELEEHDVPCDKICFEISESTAVNHCDNTLTFMTAIRAMGCHFALDNFGASMPSFTFIKSLPVDALKIDGNFSAGIADDAVSRTIVKSIADIARSMNMITIVENINDSSSLDALALLQIDYAQGKGIAQSKPVVSFVDLASDAKPQETINKPETGPQPPGISDQGGNTA